MWGTLIEQYPYLISKILVINSPTFMNVLWTACSAFIPTEYRVISFFVAKVRKSKAIVGKKDHPTTLNV
jgi:hypothetical protein